MAGPSSAGYGHRALVALIGTVWSFFVRTILPVIDRSVGTFRVPADNQASHGIDTPMPAGFLAQLTQAFQRRFRPRPAE